jgi:hypothetical protein
VTRGVIRGYHHDPIAEINMQYRSMFLMTAAVLLVACSDDTSPPNRVATGDWSEDAAAHMVVTSTGASIELVCETDAIAQALTRDASGNFDWTGTAMPHSNIAGAGSHPAAFTGHATAQQIVLTRTVTDGSAIDPITHTFVRGTTTIVPCPAASAK